MAETGNGSDRKINTNENAKAGHHKVSGFFILFMLRCYFTSTSFTITSTIVLIWSTEQNSMMPW